MPKIIYNTVGDLIEKLKTFDPDIPFGVVGMYGEFYGMDIRDVHISDTYTCHPADLLHQYKTNVIAVILDVPSTGAAS